MSEVVGELMRRDLGIVGDDLMPYYQDVYDRALRAAERTDNLRDLVTSILETNVTIQGNRLNVITKKVTGWAPIIAVPTLITGFFGMNVPYPGVGVGVTAAGRLVGAGDDVQDGQPVRRGQGHGRSHAAIRSRRSSGKMLLGMTACAALGGIEL